MYNMDAEAVRQLRMCLEWVFVVRGDTGSYRIISWIVSYFRLDCIISDRLYIIISAGSGNTGFCAIDGYWLDGTDGLNGALM